MNSELDCNRKNVGPYTTVLRHYNPPTPPSPTPQVRDDHMSQFLAQNS